MLYCSREVIKLDFSEIKNSINEVEKAKNKKREEMSEMYDELNNNQEFLDILMLQIAKDIETKYPGVQFRIISRIKSPDSFSAKVENDLMDVGEISKINDVMIYDIVALSIIIENVPDDIKANDPKFDSHIKDLINMRNESKINIDKYKAEISDYRKRLVEDEKRLEEHREKLKENKEKQQEQISPEFKTYLEDMQKYITSNIYDIEERMENINRDILDKMKPVQRTEDRYAKENNDCNNALADYIIKNLCQFENVKQLKLSQIPGRLKNKENYDGYKATHNCYRTTVHNEKGEKLNFICEIQGKSIDAFYIADRGKAAIYHINQTQVPGKIVKEKKLPEDILKISTDAEKEAFRKYMDKKVPRYRVYVSSPLSKEELNDMKSKGKKGTNGHIYKLSRRESFMLYYYNQLAGNEGIKIQGHPEEFKAIATKDILPADDGEEYEF